MPNTIELTASLPRPLDEAVDWCRSGPARMCFPGTRNLRASGDGLSFEVGIRAPGAAPAVVMVDEYMKDFGRERGGYWFETSQVWMWPNRECATSWHRYRFGNGADGTTLQFRWRYILPGLAGAQVFNAVRFSRSIQRAAEIYIDKLAQPDHSVEGR